VSADSPELEVDPERVAAWIAEDQPVRFVEAGAARGPHVDGQHRHLRQPPERLRPVGHQVADALVCGGAGRRVDAAHPRRRSTSDVLVEPRRLVDPVVPVLERERPVVFYCRVGARSQMAAQAFRAAGFDAYSMRGGLLRWAQEQRPLSPEGGEVADH